MPCTAQHRRQLPAAVLVLVAVAAAALVGSADAKPTEMSSSVILFGLNDLTASNKHNGLNANWCDQILANARQYNSKRINIVITQYWKPVNAFSDPYTIDYFCYKADSKGTCTRFTTAAIKQFRRALTGCVQAAIDFGFTSVMLTPHIDPATGGGWRGYVKMSPMTKYDGKTFWDVSLRNIAEAVNENLGRGTEFLINIQGEMGTSMFGYAPEFASLLDAARNRALLGKPQYANQVKVGFKLTQEHTLGQAAQLPGGIKYEGARRLFARADFIAISAYAPLPLNPTKADMQGSAQVVEDTIRPVGVSLKGKRLFYGEFGLGGGTSPFCDRPAKRPLEAARSPQYGTCWQYNVDLDPWKNNDVRSYMRIYYQVALDWLASGTGPTWDIDGVYLWNLGSWDIQGIHPLSYSGDGQTFKDPYVAGLIKAHNTKING